MEQEEESLDTVAQGQESGEPIKKRRKVVPIVIGAVVAVVVIAAALVVAVINGALAVPGMAAKYGTLSFISEQETTDYIEVYKTQMDFENATDEEWASFMAEYNLTPERLRQSTVRQLVCNKAIEQAASELGVSVSEDEVDAMVANWKNVYAFNDDETWENTLSAQGQTEEGFREVCRRSLLRQAVFTAAVETPEVSDEQLISYLESTVPSLSSNTTKHTYCFKVQGLDEDGSLDKIGAVQEYRKALMKDGVNTDTFTLYVQQFSNVDSLVETGGANGWDVDTTSYSAKYQEVLDGLEKGEVSEVFDDGDGYAFIWVDTTYDFPADATKISKINLNKMPKSLKDYLTDCAAYQLWETNSEQWLQGYVDDLGITMYPMPADVPYNVDMSLAQTQEAEDTQDAQETQDEQETQDKQSKKKTGK